MARTSFLYNPAEDGHKRHLKGWVYPALAGVFVIAMILFIGGCAFVRSFAGVSPGTVGICQQGGPLDGRGICGIKPEGSSPSFQGTFNELRLFPATQRNYIISSNPKFGDRKGSDNFCTQTKDSVPVCVEAQAYFTLNTIDQTALRSWYENYGVRQFEGLYPYEGTEGWAAFLDVNFRPTLENALGNTISQFTCAELNSLCAQLKAVTAKDTGQNRALVQDAVDKELAPDLESALASPPGHPYFTNLRFKLQQVTIPKTLTAAVERLNAAKANVQTQTVNVQAAKQESVAAREKAKAYALNPWAGLSEFAKSLPTGSKPILNLSVNGGKSPTLSVGP